MADQATEKRVSLGTAARRACAAHGGGLTLLMLGQALLRIAALAPAYLCIRGNEGVLELPFSPPVWAGWAATAVIYLLAVFPARFWAGERLRYYSAPRQPKPEGGGAYGAFLRCGLLRCLRGLTWGLPFCTGVGLFLYGMEYLPYNTLGQIVQKFAGILGGEGTLLRGLMVIAGLLALFLLLFLWGWRRDVPMEYLPARRLGAAGVCRFAEKARLRGRGEWAKNSLWNLLLFLPTVIGCVAVLLPYARAGVRVMSNPLLTLKSVLSLIRQPLPPAQLAGLAGVLLVLYLPLCALRKMRCAVLTRRLTREWNGQGGGHAAG